MRILRLCINLTSDDNKRAIELLGSTGLIALLVQIIRCWLCHSYSVSHNDNDNVFIHDDVVLLAMGSPVNLVESSTTNRAQLHYISKQ